MKKIVLLAALLIVQVFFVGLLDLSAQSKDVAVTIDDLPLNGQQFNPARLRAMTDKFLVGLNLTGKYFKTNFVKKRCASINYFSV